MAREPLVIRGYVEVEVTRPDGSTARAAGSNAVVDGGRQLVAKLLTGEAQSPTFAITAGVSDKETVSDLTKLFDPDGLEPVTVTDVKIKDGVITLRGSFPKAERERLIKEAGLLLTCKVGEEEVTTLYNRALVKPQQSVRAKEVLTLTWQLSFAPQGT
ncbi:MAG: hypothetical protein ACOY94_07230 [Bacillota bacterium]